MGLYQRNKKIREGIKTEIKSEYTSGFQQGRRPSSTLAIQASLHFDRCQVYTKHRRAGKTREGISWQLLEIHQAQP